MPPPITLKSPLPANDLLFESMNVSAGLSMLEEMQLGLLSDKPNIKPADLLGKPMTVTVLLADDAKRHFHGYVTRFGIGPRRGRFFGYQVSVRPWLWFLTRTADCKIFQEQTVPEIVKKVFQDHPHANFEFKLFRTYRKWVYCVQYRETDYNFIARLLEHEGIYWYVEHSDGQSKLVLVDSQSAHDPAPGCEKLPYYEEAMSVSPSLEYITDWRFISGVETDKVQLTSYDFERPSVNLKVDAKKQHDYKVPTLEVFDFHGDYVQAVDGSQLAEDYLDEYQTQFEVASGRSNAYGMEVGRLVTLTRHPRDDQNAEYLLTQTRITLSVDGYESGGVSSLAQGRAFECDFNAIPSKQQFRPRRLTPKPVVQGPQTARVVGPGDIHTDKFGRVKLQFHWDRYGKRDHDSSCWVRVSQNWGGKGWGGMFIPHVGQEVIVEFLEGDPDQPLVTGRVYNAENMPPVTLPAGKTVSVISDHGGNSIKMEGNGGSQQIKMFSPTGNTTFAIGAPNSPGDGIEGMTDLFFKMTVGLDWKETISGMKTSDIKLDEETKVQGNSTKLVLGNSSESVWGHKDTAIKGYKHESILGSERKEVYGLATTTITGMETKTNLAVKNDIIVALNTKLTKGGLIDINNAKILRKSPTIFTSGNQRLDKYISEEKEAASFKLKVTGAMTEKIAELTQAIGKSSIKVDGKYELKAGDIDLDTGGTLNVKTDLANFSGDVRIEKDLNVRGDTFKFGSTFTAKK